MTTQAITSKTTKEFMGHLIEVWKQDNGQRRGRWGGLLDDPYWYGSIDGELVFAGALKDRTTKKYAVSYCEAEIWKRVTKNGTQAPQT